MADAVNYGRIALLPKGDYSAGTLYQSGDVVSYGGSSYLCKGQPPMGTLPTDTNYWQLSAEKGEKGDKGDQGEKGEKGEKGDSGAQVDVMTGATSSADGKSGLVPKPLIADKDSFLKGDGTWGIVDLSSKGDALFYDEENSELQLKSGDTILSTVTIEGGGGTIVVGTINVTVDDELLYGATVNVTDGTTTYNGVIDSAGKASVKVNATGDYTISFPSHQKYTGTVTVEGAGKIYNVPIHVPVSNVTVSTSSEDLFGKTVTLTLASALIGSKVFDSNNQAVFKVYDIGTYKATCEGYEENANVTELDADYAINLNTIPDGATVEPIDDVVIWQKCAGLMNTGYTTLDQVLADTTTIGSLTMDENAMKYLARSEGFADTLCANETFMTYLGQSPYVDNTVLNSSNWVDKIANSEYFLKVFHDLIPEMTGYDCAAGSVTQVGHYAQAYEYNAFSKDNVIYPCTSLDELNSYKEWYYYNQNAADVLSKYLEFVFNNPYKVYMMEIYASTFTALSPSKTLFYYPSLYYGIDDYTGEIELNATWGNATTNDCSAHIQYQKVILNSTIKKFKYMNTKYINKSGNSDRDLPNSLPSIVEIYVYGR